MRHPFDFFPYDDITSTITSFVGSLYDISFIDGYCYITEYDSYNLFATGRINKIHKHSFEFYNSRPGIQNCLDFMTNHYIHKTQQFYTDSLACSGLMLKHIKVRTKAICFNAIRNNGNAIQYVKKPSLKLCLIAVRQNGLAIIHIKKQHTDVIQVAIEQNADAYSLIDEFHLTIKICYAAVKAKPSLMQTIPEYYRNKVSRMIYGY